MDSTKPEKKRRNKDFESLGKMLGCKTATAKMRYYRQNEQAMEFMLKIVEAKEKVISENKPEEATH